MSYTPQKNWSEYKDSNLGPPGPKPGALPDCATLRIYGAQGETRTRKIWLLRPTRIPIPSPGRKLTYLLLSAIVQI